MEPEVVGGSAGHCGLVRCVEADDPRTPISVVDGPVTGGVRGAVSRDPWHGYLRCDGSARLQACVASELIWWFMAVVDPIQLPRLNCCAGKSCSVLASWSASLASLFSPFIVNDSKSLDSLRSFLQKENE